MNKTNENQGLYHLAYDKMSRYLGVRDHSLDELHIKLSRKFPEDIVHQVLEKATENGWVLPPIELAKNTVENLHRKNKGYLYISNYLQQKGLPEVARDDDIELKKACAIVESHFRGEKTLDEKQKQKALRLLHNRGFDNQTIENVIHEIY